MLCDGSARPRNVGGSYSYMSIYVHVHVLSVEFYYNKLHYYYM